MNKKNKGPDVHVQLVPDVPLAPLQDTEFTGDLPKEREACIRAIMGSVLEAQRRVALHRWYIGRVIRELQSRGEAKVFDEIMEKTQFEKRVLQYCVALYESFPNFDDVKQLALCIEWTQFKELTRIDSDEARKLLCDKIMTGELDKNDVKDEVEAHLTSQKPTTKPKKPGKDFGGVLRHMHALIGSFNSSLQEFLRDFKEALPEMQKTVDALEDEDKVTDEEYGRYQPTIVAISHEAGVLETLAEEFVKEVREHEHKWIEQCPPPAATSGKGSASGTPGKKTGAKVAAADKGNSGAAG